MIREIKTKIDEVIRSTKDNMISIYSQHPYWINRDLEAGEDKIIRRALVMIFFLLMNRTDCRNVKILQDINRLMM